MSVNRAEIYSSIVKVQYTFEKDQQNCLARWPHTLQIQTIPIDDRNVIGIVDLRICLQALAQCSPEIINQPDKDYAVYALDYSEDDIPLVGQGMLSWGLEQQTSSSEQKLVTGRVTQNMLAALRGGVPETLEVRLKLNAVPRMQRPQTSQNPEMRGYGSNAPTPTPTDGNSEWSSFMQSNPNMGWSTNGPTVLSPGFPPPRYGSPIQAHSPAPEARPDMYVAQTGAPTPPLTNAAPTQTMSFFPPIPSSQGLIPDDAPALPKTGESGQPTRPKPAKRASSKAPKKRATTATGNPRGRPPKHRSETGNTSAIEDATDADEAPGEGPKKKRAKTTKADWPNKAPLNSAPGSLRVAASTSGSLRTMRPAASGSNGVGASHLQEVPRAPTPVPGQTSRPRGRPAGQSQARRSSMAEFEGLSRTQGSEMGIAGPLTQEARSPSEAAHSPFQAYTPDGESPGDIGSSPPVPRSTHSVRSSPPPSSPVLPPMPIPMPQPDSGFMSGGFDDLIDEDDLQLPMPMPATISHPTVSGRPKPSSKAKAGPTKPSAPSAAYGPPRPASRGLPQPPFTGLPRPRSQGISEAVFQAPPELASNGPVKQKEMVIQQEYPGPQELLPKKSIYNPSASAKAQMKNARATGTTKAAARQLKRANTEPNLQRQETSEIPAGPPTMPPPHVEPKPREPEVQLSEPLNQSTIDAPSESVEEVHAPAPTPAPKVPETVQDPSEHLLRLLSEPMEVNQDIDQDLPSIPAPHVPHPVSELPAPPNSEALGPGTMAPVPASDPGVLIHAKSPSTDIPDDNVQPSKNMSRKQSIREKLEQAVQNGQMPTFCSNCGSISTPTWRKIWTQDSDGSPDIPEYSDKPGCITAIMILQRDDNGKPTQYRTVKKALGPSEKPSEWTEAILCNREY